MHIGKRWLALMLTCFVASVSVLMSCAKEKTKNEATTAQEGVEAQSAGGIESKSEITLESYETLLEGVWNVTGDPVVEGVFHEFPWGTALVDDRCVEFSFAKAEIPFVVIKKLLRYVRGVAVSEHDAKGLELRLFDNYRTEKGTLTIRFLSATEIVMTASSDVFDTNVQYGKSYYKVAGPGVSKLQ